MSPVVLPLPDLMCLPMNICWLFPGFLYPQIFRWHIFFLHLIPHWHWNHVVLMTVHATQMSLFILTLIDIQSFIRNSVLGLLAMSLDLFCVANWRVSETMTLLLLSPQNLLHYFWTTIQLLFVVVVQSLNHTGLFANPGLYFWTVAHQAPYCLSFPFI